MLKCVCKHQENYLWHIHNHMILDQLKCNEIHYYCYRPPNSPKKSLIKSKKNSVISWILPVSASMDHLWKWNFIKIKSYFGNTTYTFLNLLDMCHDHRFQHKLFFHQIIDLENMVCNYLHNPMLRLFSLVYVVK